MCGGTCIRKLSWLSSFGLWCAEKVWTDHKLLFAGGSANDR